MIARLSDGLILTATVNEDEEAGRRTRDYQGQAKMLFRKLGSNSTPAGTIETGPYVFHYIIDRALCYLALCEKAFSRRLAFNFLEDIQKEFIAEYGSKLDNMPSRPYAFIAFDNFITKKTKAYQDSRARRNLANLNSELQDVQRIMVQNIDEVLQRGSALSELDTKASNLSILSQKYKKDARYLNLKSAYAKAAAAAVVVFVFVLYFWVL